MGDFINTFAAWNAIVLTDHTVLKEDTKEEDVLKACHEATETCPFAYGLCIPLNFVKYVNDVIKKENEKIKNIRVSCVINFPHGLDSKEKILDDTKKAIKDGVDEIDLVINYKLILENEEEGLKTTTDLVKSVKELLKDKIIKVIIEVGELKEKDIIIKTVHAVLDGNGDFIKTSTGKTKLNATPAFVNFIIEGIKLYLNKHPNKKVGIKVTGNVRALNDACHYMLLARKYLNEKACDPNYFRIGSSSLVNNLRPIISQCPRN